jgi:hypothetical protein
MCSFVIACVVDGSVGGVAKVADPRLGRIWRAEG